MKPQILPQDSHAVTIDPALIAALEPLPLKNQLPLIEWMPRPWNDELMGCIFLPRVLEKGRQILASERQGRDLMNGYLFGDFDYADGMLLRFLRTKEVRVLELLRDLDNDEAVAAALFQEGRRSTEEIKAWSRRFRIINAPFTLLWDADEGRREPGFGTSVLKLFYNFLMMPPVYLGFRIAAGIRRHRQGYKRVKT